MQKTPLFPKGRVVVTLMTLAATLPVMQVHAQSSIAMREIARRQEATAAGDRLLAEGRAEYASGDYQKAVDKYRQALDKLPVGPVVQDRREEYIKHLADGSVALSQAYRKVGKYEEARALLQNVLKADPQNLIAQREMTYLDDPIRTNPALTYEHTQNVDKVRRGLYTAEGAYNIGKFDQAKREYENVLRVDPYNSAAQRGIERVNAARSEYYKAAYDRTRSEMLTQVDKAWETVLPGDVPVVNSNEPAAPSADAGISYINDKLRRIVIPNIDFDNTSLDEAIDFLRLRANELDTTEIDPARKGINFVVRAETAAPGVGAGAAAGAPGPDGSSVPAASPLGAVSATSPKISQLRLRNVPLTQALRYICEQAKYRYEVDDFSVVLIPLSQGGSSSMYTRTFQVSPNFRSFLNEGGSDAGSAPANSDPFATPAAGNGGLGDSLKPQKSVQELIASKGVKFPEGSTIFLSGNRLTVRNSPENLDLIETLVNSSLTGAPKQVKITTKFVEISQENTEELGFDWVVSPFGFASTGSGVAQAFLGGGVMGNGAGRVVNNFIGNVNGNAVTGLGGSGQPTNIVTGGLRSGDSAITRNSIDAVLNNPNRTSQSSNPAPGILGLTGVFDQNQIQMIMRGLSQKKGADLMTAPSVLAKSAQKATIEIVREFIYPTEYEPPQLPNSVGVGGTTGGNGGLGGLGVNTSSSAGIFPVTPATPTAFETRNTGVSLEIEPTITDNDLTIDLKMLPQIVEFEGFVNYGSPIQSFSTNALGQSEPITITENRIEMPVFSRRSVNTSLTIYDGYTVAVGGLMREDVQNVEDKVPILGDIPVVGRLFQSKSENRVKSNLIIFVTAQIIDAAGRPLRGSAEASTPSVGGGTPVSTEVGLPAVGGVNDAPADGVIPLPN